jgi:hypothetical protein
VDFFFCLEEVKPMEMTKKEIRKLRLQAVQMAQEAGLKVKAAGDGLFRLDGHDWLLCAGEIVELLSARR